MTSRRERREIARTQQDPIAQDIPPPDRATIERVVEQVIHTRFYAEFHSGPLPAPRVLQGYKDIDERYPDLIINAFVKQEDHRQSLERIVVVGENRRAWAGIACALLVALTFLAAAVYIVETQHSIAAAVVAALFGLGGVGSIAGAFIYGTNSRRQEREGKARLMAGQQPPPDSG